MAFALPRDSAFWRAEGTWTVQEELTAALIEVTDRGQLWWFAAHAKKGTRQPQPIEINRANRSKPEARKATSEELAEMFAGRVRYVPTPAPEEVTPDADRR